jgi:hypothetical protein
MVRNALKRLKRKGLVVEIVSAMPNNHGGNLWLRVDRAIDYYRSVVG